jgi:hypothetical protein
MASRADSTRVGRDSTQPGDQVDEAGRSTDDRWNVALTQVLRESATAREERDRIHATADRKAARREAAEFLALASPRIRVDHVTGGRRWQEPGPGKLNQDLHSDPAKGVRL